MEREKIVIIGGGAVGAATAYWLSRDVGKYDITVLEKDPSYKTASFALSMGGFRSQFLQKENILLGKFAREFFKDKDELFSTKRNGYLLLFNKSQAEEQRKALKNQMECGVHTTSIDGRDVGKYFDYVSGDGIEIASFTDNKSEGFIDPYSYVQWLKGEATRNGVLFRTAKVDSIKDINADRIVVATGAWIAELLPELPIKPVKHSVFKVSCPTFREDMPLIGDFNSGVYLRPEGKEYLVGSPRFVNNKDYDFEAEWNDFDEIIWPALYERIPEMAELKMTGGYAGQYDMSKDGNAIVGHLKDNIYFAGGFSGRGLMQSIGVGRALTELIETGKYQTIDLSVMSLDRFSTTGFRKEPYVL